MSDVYHGKVDDKRYTSDDIDVTFSGTRCIHAAYCVSRLGEVFDVDKRPWIQPSEGSAERIATVVEMCPSGAVHYERKDGVEGEQAPAENVIELVENAYLRFHGDIDIVATDVEIVDETRASLCRCGMSSHKPFCDNTHRKIGWKSGEVETRERKEGLEQGGKLKVEVTQDGPIGVSGNFEIRDGDGNTVFQAEEQTAWLCRCGASGSKPFCDGTHNKIDWQE